MTRAETLELLERLHDKYNGPDFIGQDPISIPHSYSGREDREISGFLAATIAWGNRKAIVKNARRMMEYMDDSPYDFTVNATGSDLTRLSTFVHRTFNGGDFAAFIRSLQSLCAEYGSIGGFFESEWETCGDMRKVLSLFRKRFFSQPHPQRCEKHLSSIDKGAACKRLCMYLRWMVRRDDRGVDFGLWTKIPMSELFLPLDLHAGNMSRALGLLSRCQNDWKAVEEATSNLREYDPDDPVKYDFSLFGAGIDGFLNG